MVFHGLGFTVDFEYTLVGSGATTATTGVGVTVAVVVVVVAVVTGAVAVD